MIISVEFESMDEFNEYAAWKASREQARLLSSSAPLNGFTKLEDSHLDMRGINALRAVGILTIQEAVSRGNLIMRVPNFGKKSYINLLKEAERLRTEQ